MAVAFMMFIKELRRNGSGFAATAENRFLPPIFFLPFLAELDILGLNLGHLIFFSKNLTQHSQQKKSAAEGGFRR